MKRQDFSVLIKVTVLDWMFFPSAIIFISWLVDVHYDIILNIEHEKEELSGKPSPDYFSGIKFEKNWN